MDELTINTASIKKSIWISWLNKYFSNYSGLPIYCWKRIAITFVNEISGGICFYLSLYFVNILHFNISEAGLIISFYGVGTTIGGVYGGKLADKFSAGVSSVTSLLVKSLLFFVLVELNSFSALILLVLCLGFVSCSFTTSNNVWILSHCKDSESERLKGINILYTISNLGMGFSALVISSLAHFGFNYIFYFVSLFLFLSTIYLFVQNQQDKNLKVSVLDKIMSQSKQSSQDTDKSKIIWLILTCVFLVGLIIAQRRTTYSIYIHNLFPNIGIHGVSLLLALNPFIIVLCQVPLTNFIAKYNKLIISGVGAFMMGLGMLMLSFSYQFIIPIIACVIYTFGEMLFISMAQLLCYQHGAPQKKGQSFGLFKSTYALSIIAGPVVGGFLYHHLSGEAVWYFCGLIGMFCLLACLTAYYKFMI